MNTITATVAHNRTVWLLLSFGLAVTIAALTLMPQASMPVGPQGVDKLYHMAAFATLIFPTALLRPKWCLRFGCLAILYGGLIEAIQPIFGRSADMSDFWADGLGVAMGIFLGLAARRIFFER
ncbi:MAG: VanZ family protein [Loktanella salsilacus]|uniref:VanZ family protein n=1 Tax=Loktanella salsilacus TaxID=195913 RepID=UPI003989F40F